MGYALGIPVAAILAMLGLLHVAWACGLGRGALRLTIPEVGARPAFAPTPLITLAVAAGLFAGLAVVLGRLELWGDFLPRRLFGAATWALAAVFLLRAIGEFRLVGFFKRIRDTLFARWDTRLYSPLCLAIALALVGVALS